MTSYHIDKELTYQEDALIIQGKGTVVPPLLKWRLRGDLYRVPFSQSLEIFTILAGTGQLYLGERSLVCDFFAQVEFLYSVKKETIRGFLLSKGQKIDIQECDLICPYWFIRGIVLKPIAHPPSKKILKELLEGKAKLEDLEGENGTIEYEEPLQPNPVLVLKDRSGAFADLWMDYANQRFPYHETKGFQRKHEMEKGWEKDLLETGFIKKNVGSSHYFCPMDKVSKSLTFLLEIGWQIEDFQGRKLFKQGNIDFDLQKDPLQLVVKGKICFGEYETDITNVVGAFNRNERFVELAQNCVGLIALEGSGLDVLAEEGEYAKDSIKIDQNKMGLLSEFPAFKTHLTAFTELSEVELGTTFEGKLRPYQHVGVNWLSFLYKNRLHGILADDMGLGKTVQVIAFISTLARLEKPSLVVLPTTLIFNWKKEFEKFLPSVSLSIHHGPSRTKDLDELQKKQLILTTYRTLAVDIFLLKKVEYQVLILDEAQAIKNSKSQTAQAVCSLHSQFRLSLTGTPLENHLGELWSHFKFLIPDLFGKEQDFAANLKAGESDLRYLQRIKKKIRPFILRRKKEEVAKDLPEKIEQVVWVEMEESQRAIYNQFLMGFRKRLLKKVETDGLAKHRMEVLEALLRLRQICCHPLLIGEEGGMSSKMETLLNDIENVVEEGRKALVYSQFTTFLSLLGKDLKEKNIPYAYLDGQTAHREKVVTQFQEDQNVPLFLISLKAGSVGLNLTAADYVFLYDPWWNEAAENQAIDRAHRIGRKDQVIAKRYVALESVEEKIMKLKKHKRELITHLLDDELPTTSFTAEEILSLFE